MRPRSSPVCAIRNPEGQFHCCRPLPPNGSRTSWASNESQAASRRGPMPAWLESAFAGEGCRNATQSGSQTQICVAHKRQRNTQVRHEQRGFGRCYGFRRIVNAIPG